MPRGRPKGSRSGTGEIVAAAVIAELVDMEAWGHCRMVEKAERESIVNVIGQWRNFLRQASENSEGHS